MKLVSEQLTEHAIGVHLSGRLDEVVGDLRATSASLVSLQGGGSCCPVPGRCLAASLLVLLMSASA